MYEKSILFDGDIQKSTPTDTQSNEIDYQEIEKAMYNALKRLDTENKVQEKLRSIEPDTDLVEFSSGTDARMLTGSVSAAHDRRHRQSQDRRDH